MLRLNSIRTISTVTSRHESQQNVTTILSYWQYEWLLHCRIILLGQRHICTSPSTSHTDTLQIGIKNTITLCYHPSIAPNHLLNIGQRCIKYEWKSPLLYPYCTIHSIQLCIALSIHMRADDGFACIWLSALYGWILCAPTQFVRV